MLRLFAKIFEKKKKIEAPVVDHLRNLGANGEEYEVLEYFPM